MIAGVLQASGGVGLFLLGMLVMTEGLRALAGAALRRMLARFTNTTAKGALAGAAATAVLQSSSATTVMAVSFVSAGLMTFPQGLGLIFGANMGTTATGWLVALLGFKLNLGMAAAPLVLAGALARLLGSGRLASAGWALAGFGLIFVGIAAMQAGMAPFRGVVTPADFPDDTLGGRALLVLIGVAVTLVTQSSSAGVATALAAIGAGAISFPQAAAMVIGMDVGTTVTAALATVGGSTATRRTGFAHVIYNLLTGVMAFFLLVPYSAYIGGPAAETGISGAQFALVLFHSLFNAIGVLLILPFAHPFARLIEALFPERGPHLTRRLETGLQKTPDLAAAAAAAATRDVAQALAGALGDMLKHGPRRDERVIAAGAALTRIRDFIDRIPPDEAAARHLRPTLHALDHLARLTHRLEQTGRVTTVLSERRLRRLGDVLAAGSARLARDPPDEEWLDRQRQFMRRQREGLRGRLVAEAPRAGAGLDQTLRLLDALRWLHRTAYHLWRIAWHIRRMDPAPPTRGDETEAAEDTGHD